MVMVSINFASLNHPLRGRPRPTGFPHAHPRIPNILGHGSMLMAIGLLAIWLVPWPKPRLGPRPRQWPQGQGHGHGSGPKQTASKGIGSWSETLGNLPKPLGPRLQPGILIFWIIGYFGILMFSVLGIWVFGYWVFGKWVSGSGYRVAASLSNSNTLDARMGRRIIYVY